MTTDTKVQAFIWDEHEEPQEIGENKAHNSPEQRLMLGLRTKEYGKLVRIYPSNKHTPAGELVLHYRAFTDEHRGRIIVGGTDLSELDTNYQEQKKKCAVRVFTPAELYALKPIHADSADWHTLNVHLSNEVDYFNMDHDAAEKAGRMETRTLVDYCSDGRRTWTLETVWFDNKPVMVVNSSGRDGDEYHERWITDGQTFGEMVTWLRSFIPATEETGYVTASTKIAAMTEFYGNTIHDYYDVDAQELKKQ